MPELRTADDALIRVKLMLFYELRNIEHMVGIILFCFSAVHVARGSNGYVRYIVTHRSLLSV